MTELSAVQPEQNLAACGHPVTPATSVPVQFRRADGSITMTTYCERCVRFYNKFGMFG